MSMNMEVGPRPPPFVLPAATLVDAPATDDFAVWMRAVLTMREGETFGFSQCGKSVRGPKRTYGGEKQGEGRVSGAAVRWRDEAALGLRQLPPVPLPPPPASADATIRGVWQAVGLLYQVRWARWPGSPLPLARPFVAEWSGYTPKQARRGIEHIHSAGAIAPVGTWQSPNGPARLWLPHGCTPPPGWHCPRCALYPAVPLPPARPPRPAPGPLPPILARAARRGLAALDHAEQDALTQWRTVVAPFFADAEWPIGDCDTLEQLRWRLGDREMLPDSLRHLARRGLERLDQAEERAALAFLKRYKSDFTRQGFSLVGVTKPATLRRKLCRWLAVQNGSDLT